MRDSSITQPGTGDNITVSGNAALNNADAERVQRARSGVSAGYRILSYGGTLSGNGLSLGTVGGDSPPAATIQSLTGDKQINLVLGPSTTNAVERQRRGVRGTRAGGGDGTWSAGEHELE